LKKIFEEEVKMANGDEGIKIRKACIVCVHLIAHDEFICLLRKYGQIIYQPTRTVCEEFKVREELVAEDKISGMCTLDRDDGVVLILECPECGIELVCEGIFVTEKNEIKAVYYCMKCGKEVYLRWFK
jgi:hypothetical protein